MRGMARPLLTAGHDVRAVLSSRNKRLMVCSLLLLDTEKLTPAAAGRQRTTKVNTAIIDRSGKGDWFLGRRASRGKGFGGGCGMGLGFREELVHPAVQQRLHKWVPSLVKGWKPKVVQVKGEGPVCHRAQQVVEETIHGLSLVHVLCDTHIIDNEMPDEVLAPPVTRMHVKEGMLGNNFNQDGSAYQPHWWLVTLSQGLCLILASCTFSIRPRFLGAAFIQVCSVLLTVFATFICCSSVVDIVAEKTITIKACLDLLSLPVATLLLLYGFWCTHEEVGYVGMGNGLHKPLNTDTDPEVADSECQVTPFAKAGFFSEMSFWWLNPLMKMGYVKPLEDKDLPPLGATDRAQNQYLMFMEKLNTNKQSQSHATPSIFWTIVSCHKRAILVSGYFALLKVLTLSTGPVLLKAFINVSLGKGTFKYEGYVLAAIMFICKCCESLSQREWYFRTRRLGLQVIEGLREIEYKWLSAFQLRRAYNSFLFWSSPVMVSAATFLTCYLLKIPLDASNVFTFVTTLRLVQEPVRSIPNLIGVVIQAKVAFTRISKFLDAPELNGQVRKKYYVGIDYPIAMNSCSFSWDENPSKATLRNINLVVKGGEKVAICGEVGSGKSTLLAAVLGEVPKTEGTVSSDLSIIDLDVPFAFMFSLSASLNAYSNLGVLAVVTWEVLFVCVPMIVLAIRLQRYYLASAKELMRISLL
ncbi:hypothetical protein ACQ4PT_006191 [Festuca glaucescens]